MEIRKTTMTGYQVRARKISGSRWMVYVLLNDEKPDRCGNRKPIDIVFRRKDAYSLVKNLDEPKEE